MADDLKDIFNTAAGSPDPVDNTKNDQQDLKAVFEAAHNSPDPIDAIKDQEGPDWSKTESLGQGALQGATLGYSDELGGAEGAAMEKLLGNPRNKSVMDLYKEYRDLQRGRNKSAEESNPVSYGAGNLLGGVGAGIAAAPASVAGAGALGVASGLGNSDADLTDPNTQNLQQAAKDTAIGGGLGLAGGKIAQKLSNALTPEELEVGASKLASKSVGIKPSKELARAYNAETGRTEQGSGIIKGIGKTAMEENALPLTGGPDAKYDAALDAIDNNYKKLGPIFQQTQTIIDQNPEQALETAGNIGDKTANFLYDFRNSLGNRSDGDKIMKGIDEEFVPYIQKLVNADGNLQQLNILKRGLQDQATDLSAAAFQNPASDLKPKAEFVTRLSGIVRQHIEDLADAADSNVGQAISNTNKTLSNLYTYKDAVKKLMDKGSGSLASKTIDLPSKILTGNTTGQTLKTLGAKALNTASKAIDTPAGDLVQKAVVASPLSIVNSPFAQKTTGQVSNLLSGQGIFGSTAKADEANIKGSGTAQATRTASNLYNATDDSLKDVASNLSKTPGLEFYADHLNRAIDTNDIGEKNRAIFLIMQNPQSRKLVTPSEK